MNLETVFLFSVYCLTAASSAMLAYGEETPFPSAITVVLSIAALFWNERQGTLRINTLVSNILGLAALAVAGYEFFGEQIDARLLAGAHFLVYITWIVLFQAKEIRQYWWLCALSLLQVAVGSVLTLSSGWYGVFVLGYLFLAIWTLSVFTLYQGAFEFGGLMARGRRAVAGLGNRAAGDLVTQPPLAFAMASPAAALKSNFDANRRALSRNAIQQDSPGRWIVPRFVWGVLALSIAGLVLGLAIFLMIPRVWLGSENRFQRDAARGKPITGFSSEVRLGQLGQILESTERVMRVALFDRDSETPVEPERFAREQGLEAAFFRGSVLDVYGKGRWTGGDSEVHMGTLSSAPRVPGMLRQEYTLEATGSEVLFAISPFSLAALTDPYEMVLKNVETNELAARVEGRDPVKYYVFSMWRPGASDSQASRVGEKRRAPRLPDRVKSRCLQLPAEGVERVMALARKLTAEDELPGGDEQSLDRRKALALEAHLRDSGTYDYSLNMAIIDASSDPVEDFLFNRKRGHCEYFASALALMLRSVKIPSRLITGFKGADYDPREEHYEVQQRHAHAWVEAHVDGDWIVLDPTPGGRDENVRNLAVPPGFWKNARDSISSFWSAYVVSLSLSRQQESLYDPLQGSMSGSWTSVRGIVAGMGEIVQGLKSLLLSPDQFLSPRGAAVALIATAVLLVVYRAGRRLGLRRRRVFSRRRGRGFLARGFEWLVSRLTGRRPDAAGIVVAFYAEFQALLISVGFARRLDQTQREFARQIEQALSERLSAAGLHRFPSELASLFYRVRFGNGLLEPVESAAVEESLSRLRESLAGAANLAASKPL